MITLYISDILVFLSSTVKFGLGASAVIACDMGLPGTLSNILGGITGIILFTYLGSYIRSGLMTRFPVYFARKFSRGSRFIVKIKKHYGLNGIAFLTPILLSIPIGVLVALDLTTHKRQVVVSMVFSCIFWSMVFFVPYFFFNIDLIGWFRQQF